jgi:hypothetical protein
MRLTRWISLALTAVVVLAVAGIAVAHRSGGPATPTEPAAATFTAAPNAEKTATRQCTGADGTYNITRAVYNGTSTGDARLTGNLTIKLKSVVNTTTGLGHSEGQVVVRAADTGELKAVAGFAAVNTEQGVLNGFLTGKVKTATTTTPKAKRGREGNGFGGTNIAANFSAALNADGSALTGELGGGSAQNTAVLYGDPCQPAQPAPTANPNANGDDGRRGNGDGRNGGRDH